MLRTIYPLTTAYTAIPALRFSRRVELAEDGATAVGLLVKFPDDNFTQACSYPAVQQPVVLGNATAQGHGQGPLIGIPVQTGLNAKAASTYCMVAAASGTTNLRVTEID